MEQTFYDRVKMLCEGKNFSVAQLEHELGFSNGTISKWKTFDPQLSRMKKVANFFHVSMDYLAGLSDIQTPAEQVLQDEDIVALQKARERMTEEEKLRMMQLVRIGFSFAFDEELPSITL